MTRSIPMALRRLRSAVAVSVVLPLLLTACSPSADSQDPEEDGGMFATNVDVDTPDLRAAKQAAGVEDCAPGKATAPAQEGLPDVTLACLGGGPDVNLSSLEGPLVINLWAQWCGPCRDELPYYQQLHEQAGDQVKVLGIDYQDTLPGAALELVEATGVTYPLLADPSAKVRAPLKVRGLPGVVFVDEQGRVTRIEYIVIRSYPQLRDLVAQHLGVRLGHAG